MKRPTVVLLRILSFLRLALGVLALLLLSASSSLPQGVTRYVVRTDPTCGGNAPCYTTIQAAVNAAQAGDTIQIQAGTYPEQVTISGKNNVASATEANRILIEADPLALPGSVVLRGAVTQCTNGFAIQLRQSKFITLRGLTITGAGGKAIELLGSPNQNQAIHLERNRIFGNGAPDCDGGITVASGNPGTLIVNNLIYGNGGNGINFINPDGGPHYVVENTIHANGATGVRVTRDHVVFLVNNLITGNGVAPGLTGGRFGVSHEGLGSSHPENVHLLHNLVCGNLSAELNGPILDPSDTGNLTPTGTEGPGVIASPGCELPTTVYANLAGPDGLLNTADDDFTLATGSPTIDEGLDPRTLGLDPLFNPLFEADYSAEATRPRVGTPGGTPQFDLGALEARLKDTEPPGVTFLTPPASAFVRGTVTVQAQATDTGSGVAGLSLKADGQSLTATLSPTPPAASVTATASWNTLTVADGAHTLTATATDQQGNSGSATDVVIVDNTPPDTQITSGPSGTLTDTTTATFTFTGTDNLTPTASLQFAWRLDGGAFSAFSSVTSATFTSLAGGPHTFEVKARDLAGNEDPTPASRALAVVPPGDFTLTAAPASPATLRIIAGDQGAASVEVGGSPSFTNLVSLAVSAPSGITATLSSQFLTRGGTAFVTFTVAPSVAPGLYPVTITGQALVGAQMTTHSASITLEVLAAGTLAVTGQVLTAQAIPVGIPGVTITLGSAFTLTDAAGNFVLLSPPTGAQMLLVDGRTASTATAQYPPVEINLTVASSGVTRVPFPIYLPKVDTAHPVTLPLDSAGFTTQTVQATTPMIPGLVVTIPAGTRIIGPDGDPVSQITMTPVPIDRSPMPFPPGVTAPLLFTIQPGGAVPSQPLPITFPNLTQAPPGSKADLYFFDLSTGGWAIWGTGTVSTDGTQIISDPGFGLPRFAWHFPFPPNPDPPGPYPRRPKGDPVDVFTGRFIVDKTDLVLPGRFPITIQRTYRSGNTQAGPVGIGWEVELYDRILTTSGTSLALVLPDQRRYVFTPTGSGQWVNTTEPFLRGAVITQLAGEFNFQMRLKDGTIERYDRIIGFANAAGLSTITDRNGNTITMTRQTIGSAFGRITRITDAAGRAINFAYDSAGRILSITDPLARVVQYAYDAQGRLVTMTDPAGGITRYTYDANHRILTITDPRGITYLNNEYDAAGRVIRQTLADGGTFVFTYTLTGGVVTHTTVTDPRGNATTSRFNSQGFTLSTTDEVGQTTVFAYEPSSNLLLSTTDPLGRVTQFSYDAQGNVTSITDPAGNVRTFTYEPTFSRILSFTDPRGNIIGFQYDAQGNLTALADPLGNRSTLSYNSSGQPVSATDPLGHTTQFEYDVVGNLTATVDPLGNRMTREYDTVSRLVTQTDPRGSASTFVYDALNRITQITDGLTGVTGFSYDGNGDLLTVADARGSVTSHTYDSMDRLAARTDPLGHTETYAYDGNGNLATFTDRKGQVTTFSYDARNRRAGATYADGSTTSFVYDAVGRPVEASDSVGGTILNQYDLLDRLIAQMTDLGTLSYEYDALGRRTSMSAPGQAPVSYAYDVASRLTEVVQGSQVVNLQYDASGRRTRLTLPNQVSTEYQYDAASRLTALIYRNVVGSLGDLTYAYDAAGNRTAVGGSFARTLLPDAVPSATYDAANRQLTFGDQQMTYDANGNLTSVTGPTGGTTFTWDARNRLIGLTAPATTASFMYDALGRRVAKEVNGQLTEYLYDGRDIIQEAESGPPVSYLRPLNIDEPWVRNGSEFYLADPLGSAIGLTGSSGALATHYAYDPFGSTGAEGTVSQNPFQYTGRENDGTGLYYYRARYYSPEISRFLSEDPMYSPLFSTTNCRKTYAPNVSQYVELDRSLAQLIGLVFFGVPLPSIAAAFSPSANELHLYAYATNNPVTNVDPLGLDSGSKSLGCDYIGRRAPFNSPCAVKCCNEHDDCYESARAWCSMWSWPGTVLKFGRGNECDACNNEVVVCLLANGITGRLGGRKDCV